MDTYRIDLDKLDSYGIYDYKPQKCAPITRNETERQILELVEKVRTSGYDVDVLVQSEIYKRLIQPNIETKTKKRQGGT